jgi:hypothetical protein
MIVGDGVSSTRGRLWCRRDEGPDAATEGCARLGFDHTVEVDPATGRRYAMFTSKPGEPHAWGIVLVDLHRPG